MLFSFRLPLHSTNQAHMLLMDRIILVAAPPVVYPSYPLTLFLRNLEAQRNRGVVLQCRPQAWQCAIKVGLGGGFRHLEGLPDFGEGE